MRLGLVVFVLASSSIALAQPPERPTVRFGPPASAELDESEAARLNLLRRHLHRLRVAVSRGCLERDAERFGSGHITLRMGFNEQGRVRNATVEERGAPATGMFAVCLVRQVRARIRMPPGPAHVVTVRVDYAVPEPVVDVDAALAQERAARARGRCLIDAANELRAAARAVRNRRGRARRRAITRFNAARTALQQCGGLLQQLQQQQLQNPLQPGINPGGPGCIGCGSGELRTAPSASSPAESK